MNYKAFVLGAAVGFLFTLSPACGPAECEGCIDADGTCIEPGQTSQSQCGADGVACIACMANQTCNSAGLCENLPPVTTDGGTDGGNDGGDTVSTCNSTTGCCRDDIRLPGTSASNCGMNGETCASCQGSAICTPNATGGSCVTPPAANYGEACTGNADCAPIGSTALCKQTSRPGGAEYEGGYCTKICGALGSACGAGSTCIQIPLSWGEADRLCLQTCTPGSTTDCRDGYQCYGIGGSTTDGVCWIAGPPSYDAGPPAPADLMGAACTGDEDCNTETFLNGSCIVPVNENMQPTGWPAGYCTGDCTENRDLCGTTGMCLTINSQTGAALCFDRCAAGGAGQSDCRTDYVCEHYLRGLPDGGQEESVDGYCSPNCNAPGVGCNTGTTCNAQGYCE